MAHIKSRRDQREPFSKSFKSFHLEKFPAAVEKGWSAPRSKEHEKKSKIFCKAASCCGVEERQDSFLKMRNNSRRASTINSKKNGGNHGQP